MCGVGKADRRPIDPPPIVQLRVIDPLAASSSAGRTRQGSPRQRRRRLGSVDEEEEDHTSERERDGSVLTLDLAIFF